jgi:hypothetical protein
LLLLLRLLLLLLLLHHSHLLHHCSCRPDLLWWEQGLDKPRRLQWPPACDPGVHILQEIVGVACRKCMDASQGEGWVRKAHADNAVQQLLTAVTVLTCTHMHNMPGFSNCTHSTT